MSKSRGGTVVINMQTQMDRNPTSFTGRLIGDLFLFTLLAVVKMLICIRGVVRGAREIGLLPQKDASEPC
ncbi:MAG TPA: hypothetical protein VF633_13060 [Brevundimonas sp.]